MLAAGRALEGERKPVTVLFVDVVGSLELAERLGPEDWRRMMDRCLAILCEAVHRFEGMVETLTGDGLVALFGAPLAQEDHAARGCHAALRLLRQLAGFSAELRREREIDFAVRVGLNSGEVVTGAIGDDLTLHYTAVGHTVGLAQRIESLATPNTAFVSQHTAALVEGYFELRDRGMPELKGVSERVRVYELAGLGHLRSHLDVSRERGLSRFVGRERELAALQAALARAREGAGQVVGVVGESGIGKSRLCYEFGERCRRSGIAVWPGQCTARGARQPLLLVRELVRSVFGLTDWDTERAVRAKVAGRAVLDPQIETELPLILELLGVAGDGRSAGSGQDGERLFPALRRLLLGGPGAGPRVIVVEELRWIDPPSEAFLKALIEALPSTPTLLVASFRPEYRAGWLRAFNYTALRLRPLDERSLAALLRDQLGTDPSLAPLVDRIPNRVGGNPLFLEELIRELVESGGVEGERGAFRAAGPIDDAALPATVQAVLAARIDRLAERDKSVLQAAAVIGHQFTEPLLKQVTGLDDKALRAALRALIRADLLVKSTTTPAGYAFKHDLTQEVAYRSELSERRARLHGAVARALEEQHRDSGGELAGLISHHRQEAGESGRTPRRV
ncbi:MAG TPA: adenylate/guanylate cyclase domain-containing protein [Thermoleophilaceae bacterium]|nr:adenylate/guanylate cyclase domain-containing protein [Thermoleophilaceae bacterium]